MSGDREKHVSEIAPEPSNPSIGNHEKMDTDEVDAVEHITDDADVSFSLYNFDKVCTKSEKLTRRSIFSVLFGNTAVAYSTTTQYKTHR